MRIEHFYAASSSEAAASLGLLQSVLSAGGTAPLDSIHRGVLDAVARWFFRGAGSGAAANGAIPPDLRRGLAELALLMPLSDQIMDSRKVEAAASAIAGLGVSLPQVNLLRDAAAGRLLRLRLRVANNLARQLAGVGAFGAVMQVLRVKLGLEKTYGRRVRAASSFPAGTLGREMLQYYTDNPFAMPGEAGGLPPMLVGRHDYLHVLTGYDTSTEGELLLSGFIGGCAGDYARLETLVVGLMQFNQAVPVQEFAADVVTKGAMQPDSYFLSVARGAACTVDVAHPRVDYLNWLDRDLETLRRECGIGSEGMMVDADRPSWAVAGPQKVLGGQRKRDA